MLNVDSILKRGGGATSGTSIPRETEQARQARQANVQDNRNPIALLVVKDCWLKAYRILRPTRCFARSSHLVIGLNISKIVGRIG